jgi:hypothetical protein
VFVTERISTVFKGKDTMKKSLIAFAAVAFLAMTPALSLASFLPVGSAITLDQLIAGQTLQVGDKLFDNFSYTTSPGGQMPAANTVLVQGIVDSSGNYGVLFTGAFNDTFGGTASDALLKFQVSVLDPGKSIVATNLFGDPTVTGSGIASVTETFVPLPGSMNIFDNTSHTGTDSATHVLASGVQTLSVQKDILAFAGNANSTAGLTQIGQTFVQTPEPATLVLLATGAVALVPVYRRTRRKA